MKAAHCIILTQIIYTIEQAVDALKQENSKDIVKVKEEIAKQRTELTELLDFKPIQNIVE